ncbi:DUF1307 domain-containing protein [Staphylococcus simulans]|uniref:DUF1307 domain-containing protein n=1 Tax=Staphylococcus simulans TaxID=1286 RepID=UPI000708F934|nr:DUF1307 domain-containing protein [Staphylococcus simulans]PTI94866.1 DUF1307 domain-containing protein [Staphylococcus simulans]PTJ02779.1 DUF1307 domain-containing protein [Staphylococcus simulans]PTJ10087.1 DUF1307 domain-containing protein [Staphylococcus simulans]PTJ41910.1 DUF1307 domain-containing protein [Staphylococcus simulans]PTJ98034.1 DUF1307 domain-containing protein [Staphylococcus simulans]
MKRSLLFMGVIMLSLFVLAACEKEQSKTYQGELAGADVIDTLTYKGDKMVKQSMIMTIKYDENGLSKSDAENILAKQEKVFEGLKGVKYKKDIKEDKAVQKVDIDYKEADLKQLSHRVGVTGPKEGNDYVDVKSVERSLKKSGLTVKKPLSEE